MPHYPVPYRFGRSYQLLELLPDGSSGAVYKARQTNGAMVALKFFDHDPAREATRFAYFTNEQNLLRAITADRQHPYIIKHVEHNFTKEPFYVVTRYIEGAQQLGTLIGKPLPAAFVLRVVEQVSNALDYIHYGNNTYSPIVHRDVNPNNILIDKEGNAVLIDFGSALHAQFALTEEKGLGTIPYMPPEQYDGNEKPATDQFALAMVTLVMLTGNVVLPNSVQAAQKKLNQLASNNYAQVRRLLGDRRQHVTEVIVTALAMNPDNRYASCEEFAYRLRGALQQDGADLQQRMVLPRQRNVDWIGWVLMGVFIVGALLVLLLVMTGTIG